MIVKELSALSLVCSLKPSPAPSSSQLLGEQVLDAMKEHGVRGESVRVVDHDIRPGVDVDMGEGDEWPALRKRILEADILVMSIPTWVGHPSSVAQRVLERLNAETSETDEQGRPHTFGKVAVVAVVGNEDGAHKVIADTFQALNDEGFTIPAGGGTYWNNEAMNPKDYNELSSTPDAVAETTRTLAANSVHLARLLNAETYPAA